MVAKKTGKAAKSKRPAAKRKAVPKRRTKKAKSPNRRRATKRRPAPKLAAPALADYAEKTGAGDSLADPDGNPPAGTVTIHYTDAKGEHRVGSVHHDGEGGVTVGDNQPSDMRDLDIPVVVDRDLDVEGFKSTLRSLESSADDGPSKSEARRLAIQRDPDDDSSTNDNGVYHDEEEGA